MIIENQTRLPVENARLREVLAALVRHLHDFVREVHLSGRERRLAASTSRASFGLRTC
jgi:Catechol dioxygenase N terminus